MRNLTSKDALDLAEELHRQYRATEKAMNRVATIWRTGVERPNENLLLHDHGFASCGKRTYFIRRAENIIKRSSNLSAQTLGEALEALQAQVFRLRLRVEGKK